MITIRSAAGNVRLDGRLRGLYETLDKKKKVERLVLSRTEAQRSLLRRTSDAGTDIAISLERGSVLRHGDVLLIDEERMIVVEFEQENVLGFRIKDDLPTDQKVAAAIKLGHIIGNLHRPICMKEGIVYMPVQSEDEARNIKETLLPIIDHIDILHAKIVFEPEEGPKVRNHAH